MVVICWGLMKCRPLDLADTHYTTMFFLCCFLVFIILCSNYCTRPWNKMSASLNDVKKREYYELHNALSHTWDLIWQKKPNEYWMQFPSVSPRPLCWRPYGGKKIKLMRNNENNSAVTSPCPTARFLITLLPMLRLNSELVSLWTKRLNKYVTCWYFEENLSKGAAHRP